MTKENKQYLEKYRAILTSKGLTIRTIEACCDNDLRIFLEWLCDKSILDATHIDIQDFLLHCAVDRKNQGSTSKRKLTHINMLYRRLINHYDWDIRNPCDKVEKPKSRQKVSEYLTKDEYDQVINFLESINDKRGLAMVSIFFSSGCRLSEIAQLNRNSLNFDTRTFIVTGKGEKQRRCMFSEEAKIYIKEYLNTRDDDCEVLFKTIPGNRRLKDKSYQDYMRRLGRRAGIAKGVHPHIFRHTRAMDLIDNDVPINVIQKFLGHSNISSTQIYAHTNFDKVHKIVDGIDER